MRTLLLILPLALSTAVVDPAPTATVEPASSEDVFGLDPVDYGSTYSSNCSCTFCQKYCTTNGVTYKAGSCCG